MDPVRLRFRGPPPEFSAAARLAVVAAPVAASTRLTCCVGAVGKVQIVEKLANCAAVAVTAEPCVCRISMLLRVTPVRLNAVTASVPLPPLTVPVVPAVLPSMIKSSPAPARRKSAPG